jgi:hypothetical protein
MNKRAAYKVFMDVSTRTVIDFPKRQTDEFKLQTKKQADEKEKDGFNQHFRDLIKERCRASIAKSRKWPTWMMNAEISIEMLAEQTRARANAPNGQRSRLFAAKVDETLAAALANPHRTDVCARTEKAADLGEARRDRRCSGEDDSAATISP